MANSNLKEIVVRAASGAVLVLVTVSSIWFSAYSLLAAYGIFMTGALYEYYKLSGLKKSSQSILGIIIGMAFYAISGLALLGMVEFEYLLVLLLPVILSVLLATFSNVQQPFTDFGKMLGGLVYACFPFVAIVFVGLLGGEEYHKESGRFYIILFMVLVWCTDTFAYLSGKAFGKHPMAPKISPGKTWEGTTGGVIGSLLVAIGASFIFDDRSLQDILVVWFAGSILAVVGDLSESKLKRSVNVKDSGNFMPGHGGFLDRFDSILLSAPFLMVYFLLFKA